MVEMISQIKGVDRETVERETLENALRLYRLSGKEL